MQIHRRGIAIWTGVVGILLTGTGFAQSPENESAVVKQKEMLGRLEFMNGRWRGDAWSISPTGEKIDLTQTERVGPMLDGIVKVVEGRGYDKDGKVAFNAFAVISYDVTNGKYSMRSYSGGRSGDYKFAPTDEGFIWEIPMGSAVIRYTAKVSDGEWFEYGERIVGDQKGFRFFEMKLKRIGDSDWPAGDYVPEK